MVTMLLASLSVVLNLTEYSRITSKSPALLEKPVSEGTWLFSYRNKHLHKELFAQSFYGSSPSPSPD